jgi:hypothetical protein
MKIFQRRAAEIEAEPAAFPQYTAKLESDERVHAF